MSANEDNNRICRGWGCQRQFKWRRKKGLPPDECTSFEVEVEAEARQERNSRKSRMQCNAHCQTLTGMPKAAGRGRGRLQEAGADIARVKPKGLGRRLALSVSDIQMTNADDRVLAYLWSQSTWNIAVNSGATFPAKNCSWLSCSPCPLPTLKLPTLPSPLTSH